VELPDNTYEILKAWQELKDLHYVVTPDTVIASERDMRKLLKLLGLDEETVDLIIANAEDEK
jgi:hypothetical protein